MANNFASYNDSGLHDKVAAMTSQLIETPDAWGLTLDQVEELQDANTAFELTIATSEDATQLKLSANQAKFASRAELLTILGSLTQRVYGDPNVDDAQLAKGGFSPRATRSISTPNAPTALNVALTGETTLTLRWNRNGNSSTTSFIIERNFDGVWTQIGSVTASKFLVTGVEVGEKALFRAYAQRGNRRSDFSNQAVIWDSEGPGLSLAA